MQHNTNTRQWKISLENFNYKNYPDLDHYQLFNVLTRTTPVMENLVTTTQSHVWEPLFEKTQRSSPTFPTTTVNNINNNSGRSCDVTHLFDRIENPQRRPPILGATVRWDYFAQQQEIGFFLCVVPEKWMLSNLQQQHWSVTVWFRAQIIFRTSNWLWKHKPMLFLLRPRKNFQLSFCCYSLGLSPLVFH